MKVGGGFLRGFADDDAEDVGLAFEVSRACAVADSGDTHRRLWPERIAKSGDDGRASRRDEFSLDAVGVSWLPLQQIRRGGRGDRQNSVRHFCGSSADVQRGAGEFFYAEVMKTDASADDVHDGIDGTHFVKMNFFERHVVDAGFGFAKFREDRGGVFAHLGRKLRFLKDFENRAEGAMLLLILRLHFDVGGGHAVFPDFFGGELPARDLEAAQFRAEMFQVTASVDQSAERHVTANARKTIEISKFHGIPPRELPDLFKSRWRRIDSSD